VFQFCSRPSLQRGREISKHFVFPYERYGAGGDKFEPCVYDTEPSRAITSWKESWKSAKRSAGVKIRFHRPRSASHLRNANARGWCTPFGGCVDSGLERGDNNADGQTVWPHRAACAAAGRRDTRSAAEGDKVEPPEARRAVTIGTGRAQSFMGRQILKLRVESTAQIIERLYCFTLESILRASLCSDLHYAGRLAGPRSGAEGARNVPQLGRCSSNSRFSRPEIDSRRDRRVGSPNGAHGPDWLVGSGRPRHNAINARCV
jgi:hypothetical protein